MTDFNSLADTAASLHDQIKFLTAQLDAIKSTFKKEAGLGSYEGEMGIVIIRQNKDSEVFDAKKAFEHVAQHISPQLLTATKKKFTTTKAGAIVADIDLKLARAA
jgi:hypothetical protein